MRSPASKNPGIRLHMVMQVSGLTSNYFKAISFSSATVPSLPSMDWFMSGSKAQMTPFLQGTLLSCFPGYFTKLYSFSFKALTPPSDWRALHTEERELFRSLPIFPACFTVPASNSQASLQTESLSLLGSILEKGTETEVAEETKLKSGINSMAERS